MDPGTGRLFILDAGTSQIVSVAPHPTLASMRMRRPANKVGRISLKKLGAGLFRGLAYNPGNGHLYVSEPGQKKLYELTQVVVWSPVLIWHLWVSATRLR